MMPGWILYICAALMLAVAVVSAGRLAAVRPWSRGLGETDIDLAHLLTGTAMAGMLVPSLALLSSGTWDVVVAALTAWFAVRLAGDIRARGRHVMIFEHRAPHLLHCAAMLYMLFALAGRAMTGGSAPGGMTAMGGGSSGPALQDPTLTLVFALLLAGYAVRDVDRLSGRPGTGTGSGGLATTRTTLGCRITMSVTMALMLLIMI